MADKKIQLENAAANCFVVQSKIDPHLAIVFNPPSFINLYGRSHSLVSNATSATGYYEFKDLDWTRSSNNVSSDDVFAVAIGHLRHIRPVYETSMKNVFCIKEKDTTLIHLIGYSAAEDGRPTVKPTDRMFHSNKLKEQLRVFSYHASRMAIVHTIFRSDHENTYLIVRIITGSLWDKWTRKVLVYKLTDGQLTGDEHNQASFFDHGMIKGFGRKLDQRFNRHNWDGSVVSPALNKASIEILTDAVDSEIFD